MADSRKGISDLAVGRVVATAASVGIGEDTGEKGPVWMPLIPWTIEIVQKAISVVSVPLQR